MIASVSGVPSIATCTLSISDGTGPANGLTSMGEPSKVGIQPGGLVTVALTGFANKPQGTYGRGPRLTIVRAGRMFRVTSLKE